jgi:hypothetical protein
MPKLTSFPIHHPPDADESCYRTSPGTQLVQWPPNLQMDLKNLIVPG